MRVFIITGASRGLGFELGRQLLKPNHFIISIARNNNDLLTEHANRNDGKIHYINYDLQFTEGISELIKEILKLPEVVNADSIALINNAAQVTPLAAINNCPPEDIIRNIQTNLLAPILLTQALINQTQTYSIHRIIVNISSGSAKYAAPGMSVYCASKAALNMFTDCVHREHHSLLTTYTVDPGMVDTDMQETARNEVGFPTAAFFKEAKETGALQSAEFVAKKIIKKILKILK